MSVRTSFRQPGHQTASTKVEKQPLDTQQNGVSTEPSFVVKTDPSITAVKAFIGFLFGFPPFDAPPEPRFPAPQGPSQPVRGIVVKFSDTHREQEAAVVMLTLLALFHFDGPFVFNFTERVQPPAQPVPSSSRPATEQPAPQKGARTADSGPSWHHLPSRAGREASGIPLSPRRTTDDTVVAAPRERRPIEPTVTEASERAAPEAQVVAETPVSTTEQRTASVESEPTWPDPASGAYAAYGYEVQRLATADTAPAGELRPDATEQSLVPPVHSYEAYQATLDAGYELDRRHAEYVQAQRDHHDHANKSAEEARRSADEAQRLTEEATRVQDMQKAQNLRSDAEQFNARARQFEAAAQAHRANAIEFANKIADIDDQKSMFTPAAPAV